MAVAFRSGLADHLLRGRLRVTVPPGVRTLEDQLGEALGVECLFGLHVGPARANRKPVLTLVSSRGELLGYAKLGVNRLTSDLVLTETAALRRLGEAALTRVEVPKVLHSGVWGEGQLVVQSALPVWQRRVKETEAGRVAAMLEVAALGGAGRVRLEDSPFWRASLAGLRATTAPAAATLMDVAARLAPHAAVDVRLGAWHGDWHQSNMAVVADRFLVWDWERFAVGVPVGCDALHHDLQRAITVRKLAPPSASEELIRAAPRILAPFGVASSTAPIVAAAYLLHLGARYLVDDQAGAGSRLGRLDDWLVPTLQRFAASLTPTAVRVRGQGESS